MIELTDHVKKRLKKIGVLVTDSDDCETLFGLTVAETVFYLAYQDLAEKDLASAEMFVYLQLRRRHLVARQHRLPGEMHSCWNVCADLGAQCQAHHLAAVSATADAHVDIQDCPLFINGIDGLPCDIGCSSSDLT